MVDLVFSEGMNKEYIKRCVLKRIVAPDHTNTLKCNFIIFVDFRLRSRGYPNHTDHARRIPKKILKIISTTKTTT